MNQTVLVRLILIHLKKGVDKSYLKGHETPHFSTG